MRFLHISDIHYCETKIDDFLQYRDKLFNELKVINAEKVIDFILLTGDLVDRGGISFKDKDTCYNSFDKILMKPLIDEFRIAPQRILFIPGNHDIDDKLVTDPSEEGLKGYGVAKINQYVANHRNNYNEGHARIKRFKDYEKTFYTNHPSHQMTPFESYWVEEFNGLKIGFVGLNSAWRCSVEQGKQNSNLNNLLMGAEKQIFFAKRHFKESKTDFNIALLHHPIDRFEENERQEIEMYLKDAGISLLFGGHNHKTKVFQVISFEKTLFQTLARIGFTDKREDSESYQAGFTIVDLCYEVFNPEDIAINCDFYKFVNPFGFDFDTKGGKRGKAKFYISNKCASPKFIAYLKSELPIPQNTSSIILAQKQVLHELTTLWNKLTVSMIQTSFGNISDKLAEKIRKSMLPEKLEYYYAKRIFTYTLMDYDSYHFKLIEKQSFTIKAAAASIQFHSSYLVERLKEGNDLSNIKVTQLTINKQDYLSFVNETVEPAIDPRTNKIKNSFNIELQGSSEYEVELVICSIHTHQLNGYWRSFFSEITEGVEVYPPINPDYEIDTLNFANGMDIRKGFIPLGSDPKKEAELLMPGDGFALIIKRKNQIL